MNIIYSLEIILDKKIIFVLSFTTYASVYIFYEHNFNVRKSVNSPCKQSIFYF